MQTWMKGLAMAGLVVLGTTACEDTGTSPDDFDDAALRAEAALVAADAMFQDLSIAQNPGLQALGFGGMGSGPGLVGPEGGSQCQGTGIPGVFHCGRLVQGGFSFTRDVTFFDADGNEQPNGYDAVTTDGVRIVSQGSGSAERSFWSATKERSRDMLITGLLGDVHTLNGTGQGEVYRSGNPQDGMERTFDMTTGAEWREVVHRQPRSEYPYPESGEIYRHLVVTVTENGEVVRSRDVETLVTFNGTQFVTMLVNGEPYEIDLSQREVKGRFGKGGKNG